MINLVELTLSAKEPSTNHPAIAVKEHMATLTFSVLFNLILNLSAPLILTVRLNWLVSISIVKTLA
jgi:hypothetical protein